MNLDAELQGIVRENEGDLLAFARKLYEHGYRQGLASRPQSPELAAPPEPPTPAPLPPVQGPLFPARPKLVAVPDDEDDTPDEDDASTNDDEATTCNHRVRASITVGGLQKKIERLFELSRFDIEVVICRRGDRDRRSLRNTVRLGKYLLEDE